MEKGLVSVITPTYNCAKFIGETIESVQAQTYQQWEMIIVDDCSTDNTKEIVDKYIKEDSRIKYFFLENNIRILFIKYPVLIVFQIKTETFRREKSA